MSDPSSLPDVDSSSSSSSVLLDETQPGVEDISQGLRQALSPPLSVLESQLDSVITNQRALRLITNQESSELQRIQEGPIQEIQETFSQARAYALKAKNVKREMQLIDQKMRSMLRRASKLRQKYGIQEIPT